MKFSVTAVLTEQKLIIDFNVPEGMQQKPISSLPLEEREMMSRMSMCVEWLKSYCSQNQRPYELNINGKFMLTSTSDPSN